MVFEYAIFMFFPAKMVPFFEETLTVLQNEWKNASSE